LIFTRTTVAQIIDDSTRLVYGPTTSKYIYEQDLKHSDTLYHTIDTAIYDEENWEFKKHWQRNYYDLGNNGTALNPVFYTLPNQIGRTTGYEAYSPYVKQAEAFKYYDTKSPYINLNVGFGGAGRNLVDFGFSRNINAQWNVGIDIQKLSSFKQIGAQSSRENQVNSTAVDIYTFFKSKNTKYHLMFHAFRFGHQVNENGGIKLPDDFEPEDLFLYRDSDVQLRTAESRDRRTRLHLYQQYSVKPFFELYYLVEKKTYKNEYLDTSPDPDYYDDFLIREDSTIGLSLMEEWKNEAGIKGRVGSRLFYSGYLKRRDIDFRYDSLYDFARESENYIGGDVRLLITKTNEMGGEALIQDRGQYFFTGYFKNNFLTASYTSSLYEPSYLADRFFGNHYQWNNSFNATFVNSIKGSVSLKLPFLIVQPEVEITTLNDYIYFGTDKLPAQNNGTALINKYTVNAHLILGKFHLENQIIFSNISGDGADALRVPDWYYKGKWYYKNTVFNNYMEMMIGFNLRWQSAFFGDGYDPITQQFYLQNDFEINAYSVVDAFFVMNAQKFTLFAKMQYINQKAESGYFETPWYPGQGRVFDIGLRWLFFD